MNCDRWGRKLQQEVFRFWKENHSDWEHGFKVFYGPVTTSAEILIIGEQPGGKAASFQPYRERFESGDFALPETHEYISTDWRIAEEMRYLFGGNTSPLEESVKTNVNFFRAPDRDYWKAKLSKERREEMERFCSSRVMDIIDKVEPSVIIAEGIGTWDKIKRLLNLTNGQPIKRGRERLVVRSESSSPKIIGLMHPSGARISSSDKDRMKTHLLDTLAEHTSYTIIQ
ncbi:hypothetical protein [Halanaeroarchaeum sulfurireducens]|uniref:Uracil-DNA glycosylase-like domain-containing protein n=1 Tax=Halanaeroarchaeum sulfurireducens TaxID=1604004 RepID=A0A0F7PD06_9EURY|nr:hypothetical protein [Halanaeroarchaeum sulfurireducens]AKH98607.1 hypothetical protein HLASF_2146 [Halanaeroarchaeum sulfurireducens]ALG83049.1 hypothetical protein HLASA_2180 [Halanaeroarchaeum sulfurireducens]